VTVTPGRGPVFNDGDLLVAAAHEGFGICYIMENLVVALIVDGRLMCCFDVDPNQFPNLRGFGGY
jgi:hypothetical protein